MWYFGFASKTKVKKQTNKRLNQSEKHINKSAKQNDRAQNRSVFKQGLGSSDCFDNQLVLKEY